MPVFSNDSLRIDALPSLIETEFEGLPQRYRSLRAAVYAGVMLVVFAAIGVLMWFEWTAGKYPAVGGVGGPWICHSAWRGMGH